jgi:thioredoxin 1
MTRLIPIVAVFTLLVVGCKPAARVDVPVIPPLPQVSAANFEEEVLQSSQPVLVEFGVDYSCYRCDTMRPRVADVAERFAGQAKVVRVDFRAESALASQYGVHVCPTYLVFRDGKATDSVVGETPTPMLKSLVQRNLPALSTGHLINPVPDARDGIAETGQERPERGDQ